MFKILKNLKQSIVYVIVIIALLCLQAWSDLTLPDFTSKIVNNGIQSGGIEDAVPEIITKQNMDALLNFAENDNEITDKYMTNGSVLSNQQESKIHRFLGQDYVAEPGTLYILRDITKKEREDLSNAMVEPLFNLAITMNPEMAAQYSGDISQIPGTIKEQASVVVVKSLYKNMGVDTDKLQNTYILKEGVLMLIVALVSAISAILIILLSAKVAARLGSTLREKVFSKVLTFSRKELNEFSTASLITRTTNDIQQLQFVIPTMFRSVVYAPLMGGFGFIKVLTHSQHSMLWIVGVALLAIIFIIGTLFALAMPKFKKLQSLIDRLNLVSREILTGLPVIRAFNKEKDEEERFDGANTTLTKTNIFVNKVMSTMMPLLMLTMNVTMILIIWSGGHSVDQGVLQVGDMMAIIQYMMHILISFLVISMVSIMLPRAAVSARRINEILETEADIKDKAETKKFNPKKKGLVEFKNVSFRYPDADTEILSDINFTAEPGKTTAIIGSTGSGKSTIVNLIPRFYDVTGGELIIDGVNVKDVKQKDLRDIIGFVPQKGILFSGTIESNIKYSDENMSDQKMWRAAKIAQATEFINTKPKKYKDEISQGGGNVSGGQRQRLSIARAIAKNPEIFVFDDSFSALDFKTDAALRKDLSQITKNKTVIIVAQRISTILNADQIIVLDEGKVVGIGTHKELMKNNETYKQIALSQLSEAELA